MRERRSNQMRQQRRIPSPSDDDIAYEPDDRISLALAFGMGVQGIVLTATTTALAMSLFVNAAGFDEGYRSWLIVAAIVINGITTMLQSARLGPVGGGHNLFIGSAPSYIAIALLALNEAGPETLATLIVVSSLVPFALARWLPRLRQIITPAVGGIVIMLIATSVMRVAVGRLGEVPDGASPLSSPAVAAITIAVAALLGLRATGLLRLWSPLVGIVAACCAAALFGLYDASGVLDAPWVALPDPQPPGLDLTPGSEFWSLLPVFRAFA